MRLALCRILHRQHPQPVQVPGVCGGLQRITAALKMKVEVLWPPSAPDRWSGCTRRRQAACHVVYGRRSADLRPGFRVDLSIVTAVNLLGVIAYRLGRHEEALELTNRAISGTRDRIPTYRRWAYRAGPGLRK
jgi:hypothetical protein